MRGDSHSGQNPLFNHYEPMQIDFRHRDVNGGNRGLSLYVWQIVRVRQIKNTNAGAIEKLP